MHITTKLDRRDTKEIRQLCYANHDEARNYLELLKTVEALSATLRIREARIANRNWEIREKRAAIR
jgi:hypothetical protein